jgi:hypothetical protein
MVASGGTLGRPGCRKTEQEEGEEVGGEEEEDEDEEGEEDNVMRHAVQ